MSIKLPHKLAPWEPQLRIFPEQIALALGPMVQKIAALLGPFPHHHLEGHVVPDGFAGLAKRGNYDRLIASDWMLADELPEEFMRRSVMGEHLFWKVAYREPAESRSTLVLFDAGPEQLGSPRLLHLAALAAFDARAQKAKADFHWALLQFPEQDLLPGLNYGEVELLLDSRGAASARPEHFAAWLERKAKLDHSSDIWVVGSERLRPLLPKGFCSLLITDLPIPGERKLRAECRPAQGHARHIELELPEPMACAQLLRDPFSVAVVKKGNLQESSGLRRLLLNATGNKLWALNDEGRIIAIPVPNSPREKVGHPKTYQTFSSFPTVAIGRVGRSTVLVSTNEASGTLHLAGFGKTLPAGEGEYEFIDLSIRPLFERGRLSLCAWHNVAGQKPGLYLCDDAGSLLRLFVGEHYKRHCEVVHSHVLAMGLTRSGLCYAAYSHDFSGNVSIYLNDHIVPARSWPSHEAPQNAYLGYAPAKDAPPFGLVAFGYGTRWEISEQRRITEINVPKSYSVHGVVQDESYEPTLVAVADDLQTLVLHGAHGTRPLVRADSAITEVCCCMQVPLIAYRTNKGGISVYSLKHSRAVLDFLGTKP